MPSIASFHDPSNSWMGNYLYEKIDGQIQPPDGGMVIQDVTHDSFNFAKDIRNIGFWLTIADMSKDEEEGNTFKKFYSLDRANFEFNEIEFLNKSQLTVSTKIGSGMGKYADIDFELYDPLYGMKAKYVSKPDFFDEHCDADKLNILQYFIFSKYSNTPAHEPQGILQAARFYPLIWFDFEVGKTKRPMFKIIDIRFDYRLHLLVDEYAETPKPIAKGKQSANVAGVFSDKEQATLLHLDLDQAAFTAAEKPLIYELCSNAYMNGSKGSWDNIHWWAPQYIYGIGKGESKPTTRFPAHISTPGAFHAIHTHWRWGNAIRDLSYAADVIVDIPHGDDPQFKGSMSPSGPLIDPLLPNQTMNFAITKFRPELDPKTTDLDKLTTPYFEKLFDSLGPPEDISSGDTIIMWLSVEVIRVREEWVANFAGHLLIHGLFFAHNPEQKSLEIGSRDTMYFLDDESEIRSNQSWNRDGGIRSMEKSMAGF